MKWKSTARLQELYLRSILLFRSFILTFVLLLFSSVALYSVFLELLSVIVYFSLLLFGYKILSFCSLVVCSSLFSSLVHSFFHFLNTFVILFSGSLRICSFILSFCCSFLPSFSRPLFSQIAIDSHPLHQSAPDKGNRRCDVFNGGLLIGVLCWMCMGRVHKAVHVRGSGTQWSQFCFQGSWALSPLSTLAWDWGSRTGFTVTTHLPVYTRTASRSSSSAHSLPYASLNLAQLIWL